MDPYYVNPNSLQFNTEIHEPDRSSNRARHDHVGFGSHLTTKTPVMSPYFSPGGGSTVCGFCVCFCAFLLVFQLVGFCWVKVLEGGVDQIFSMCLRKCHQHDNITLKMATGTGGVPSKRYKS